MALHKAAHHLGLARRPECRAAPCPRLDGDQPVDDLAALDEARVEIAVDPVDLLAQGLEANWGSRWSRHLGWWRPWLAPS